MTRNLKLPELLASAETSAPSIGIDVDGRPFPTCDAIWTCYVCSTVPRSPVFLSECGHILCSA